MGKAWDDRVGCALVVEILSRLSGQELPNSICGSITVQEEVGSRGARTVADQIRAEVALVLEGAPADDYPGATRWSPQAAMGKGVQIRCYDPSMIGNPRLRDFLIEVAEKEGIPYQVAVRRTGATDAGVIHISGIGVPTAVVAVPVRYAHNGLGLIDLEDYAATLRLITSAVVRMDQQIFESFLP
jgi:putative aminopeptidase FrvX